MKYALLAALLACAACSDDSPVKPVAELQDPSTCMECHPKHYEEWAMSMHAYASDDPVFIAMNKRGQRETNNQLGTFCVQCHAPMAVIAGATDGTTFDPTQLPATQRGITCYFCHDVGAIADTHNNGLQLALDQTMRGELSHPSPATNNAHHTKYDATLTPSGDSSMCGSCHDVVTPAGVHLERTYEEWQTTIFASADPDVHLSCTGCHMKPFDDVVADDPDANVPFRLAGRHRHSFPAIDVATSTFPEQDMLAQQLQVDLDGVISVVGPKPRDGTPKGGICVPPGSQFTVRADNLNAGHMFPSGAGQDRRAWLEVHAFDTGGTEIFSSGAVAPAADPPPFTTTTSFGGFWDATYTDAAKTTPAHFFWDVAAEDTNLIRPAVTLDPNDPRFNHSTTTTYDVAGGTAQIDKVTVVGHVRAFSVDTITQLVQSGDLDPSYLTDFATKFPTLDIAGATATWTRATADTGGIAPTFCNPF